MRAFAVGVLVLCVGTSAGGGQGAGGPRADWTSLEVRLERAPQRVRVARLDDDPWPDIVYVGGVDEIFEPHVLGVLRNEGGSSGFAPHWKQPLLSDFGDNGIPLDTGDLDGDGFTDLVLANHSGDGSILLHFGDGSGSFPTQQTIADYGGWMDDVLAFDDDGDGDLDVIATTYDGGQFMYLDRFENLGDGTFELGGFVWIGFTVSWDDVFVAAGRITASASRDYVLAGPPGARRLQLELGGESITSEPAAHPLVADLDGNGFDDVVVVAPLENQLLEVLSDGVAPLPPSTGYPTGRHPTGLAAADLDLDGDLDLAVANTKSDSVSLLVNRGDGSFRDGGKLPVGDGPTELVAADLDLDGDPDLVVANRDGGSLTVLTNPLR